MLGFVIAMESEAEILKDLFLVKREERACGYRVLCGSIFQKDALLCVSGVGKVNAAAGACALLSLGAKLLLNFGVAGGLNDRTEIGKVYLIERAVQYDFDLTQLNGGKVGTLDGDTDNMFPLLLPASALAKRTLASGDRFNDSPEDHALLLELGADVRDMEGAAIAEVARRAEVPLVSVKAISDVYGMGSTTEQYLVNLKSAMQNLKEELEGVIGGLPL